MSGRTPYIAAIWNAGVDDGSPTNMGCRRQPPRSITRRRNGIRPCVRASSSTLRESPSICTTSSRRRPAVGAHPRRAAPDQAVDETLESEHQVVERHRSIVLSIRDEPGAERRRRRAPLRRAGGASGRPALEHADAYPHALVARMRELGLFGALVPRAYGGLDLDVTTYARVIEELCRGWMSLAGVINSHTMPR